METLSFDIEIKAPIEKVWDLLWNKETYSEWTKFFSKDSTFETDWLIGGKTYFLGKDGNGMVSTIDSLNVPTEVVFKHLGVIKNGVEDTKSKEVEEWSGAQEKYFLREVDGVTKLRGAVQTGNEYAEMMKNGFTKGFEVLKNLAEN